MARTHRPLAKHRTHCLLLQFRSRYRPDQDVGGSQGGYPSDPLTLPVLPKPPQKKKKKNPQSKTTDPKHPNRKSGLTLNKRDHLSGPPTNVLQGTTEALGSVRQGGTGRRGHASKALSSLGRSRRSSLLGLGGCFRGRRGVSDRGGGGPPGQGLLRLPQSHSTGDCDGHLDKRLCRDIRDDRKETEQSKSR